MAKETAVHSYGLGIPLSCRMLIPLSWRIKQVYELDRASFHRGSVACRWGL